MKYSTNPHNFLFLSTCRCMYVFMYVCMYVCMHAWLYVSVFACMHSKLCVCANVCILANLPFVSSADLHSVLSHPLSEICSAAFDDFASHVDSWRGTLALLQTSHPKCICVRMYVYACIYMCASVWISTFSLRFYWWIQICWEFRYVRYSKVQYGTVL